MHRCGFGFLLTLTIAIVLALTGCLGSSTPNSSTGGVSSITLSPSNDASVAVGSTLFFSATAKNATGQAVLGVYIQYIVESGIPNASAPLSITSSGSACAGAWDTSGTICSPGTGGIALVYAVSNGVSSPATTVYVHRHIDNIQIKTAETQSPPYDCFSQGQTWLFQGVAYSNGVDITSSVGPMSWSSSNTGVATATPLVPTNQPTVLNQAQVTAKAPGITELFASNSGVESAPYPYTTCLVSAVYLQIGGQGSAGNSITVNSGGSVSVTATAVDTLGYTLASLPLTWSTNNSEVAAFSSTTSASGTNSAAARKNLGGASLFASCTPPSCNIGVLPSLPIYSSNGTLPNNTQGYGTISVDVTLAANGTPPTYTAWVATGITPADPTGGCGNASGCSSALFSVTPGLNPIGSTILALPRTPNSMMFNRVSSPRLYIGSDQGLMFVDTAGSSALKVGVVSNASTPCNVTLCGKVIAISNDGKLAVVADTVSTPSQVYIYNGSNTSSAPVDLILSNPGETAAAAAFSPDQLKLFILTNQGNLYVYSTVDAFTSVPLATSATDVKFSADGSFAYVAGTPAPGNSVSGFATCDDQLTLAESPTPPNYDFVTTPGIPLQIFPSPDGQHVFALDPPYIDTFSTSEKRLPLPDGQFVCNAPSPGVDIAPMVNFPQAVGSQNLGYGNFTPLFAQLVGDGTEVVLVAKNIPAVLLFNVNDGTTASVPLFGSNPSPLSASASTDGSQVYVAACDQYPNNDSTKPCEVGTVHIVNTVSIPNGPQQGDNQQVPYVGPTGSLNMCSNQGNSAPVCLPNMVAIAPQ